MLEIKLSGLGRRRPLVPMLLELLVPVFSELWRQSQKQSHHGWGSGLL